MNHSDKPGTGAGGGEAAKTKAENAWHYLLATLYGEPRWSDTELQKKNRVSWNRYFAATLHDETRTKLIEEKRHPAGELRPFSPGELHEVEIAFYRRCKNSAVIPVFSSANFFPNFSNVEFDRGISFDGYLFPSCVFRDAVFRDFAHFAGATFSDYADFRGGTFCEVAKFDCATFLYVANFGHVTFSNMAYFNSAAFYECSFYNATFDYADFTGAKFANHAEFSKSTFLNLGRFVNASMKETAFFDRAIFKSKPPEFFDAELHQGTIWEGIQWPPTPEDSDVAKKFVRAYECLKAEMDRLKKHEDELDFFALELRSRRVLLGRWGWGLPIWLYGIFSDYGRSFLRPLVALFGVAAIGAGAFSYFDARAFWEALGLSAANTLNVFGFRRDFNLAIDTPFAWLKVFAAVQTILGAILLFLFGLGIRNKFRVK